MRRVAALILVLVAPAPASAADLMVVGRSQTLVEPRAASVKNAKVRVEGRRCRLAGRTALAALARTSLRLQLVDYGACGKPAEASGLYVRSVEGEAERGTGGWVYKLDGATPSIGAADVAGRFKASADVLWFWCRSGPQGCQRTLEAVPASRSVLPGAPVVVQVRGFDDDGRAVPVANARVTMGDATARTGPDGRAVLAAPEQPGAVEVVATKPGLVRSFPETVTVR